MKECNLITQASLEDLLLNFKFYPRTQSKTKSYLVDFRGQLERGDAKRRPHWQLYLNTSAGVSATRLLTFLSKEIMGEDNHPSIQLERVDDVGATLEYVTKPGRLELEATDWWPGMIDFRTTSLKHSIKNDEDLKNIVTKPRKWQKYINNIIEAEPDNRGINWITDFVGNTGKSAYVDCLRKTGKAVVCDIDEIRAMSKALIIECEQYERKYHQEPPVVCFDLTKQVPGKYFDTFSSLLEKVKNKRITSTFGTYSTYEWSRTPHVLVFTNTAPLFNSLSKDRFNVFEVLNEEYNYVIRRVTVRVDVMRYDGKFVEYQYVSEQASVEDIRKLNRKKKFEFPDDEIAMQLQVRSVDKDISCFASIEAKSEPIASQVINKSEPIVESENVVPQSVRSKILTLNKKQSKQSRRE